MLLSQFIKSKFINCENLTLRDDGEGVFIDVWDCEDPKPSKEQVLVWIEEHRSLYPSPKNMNDEIIALKSTNANILMKLALNGIK